MVCFWKKIWLFKFGFRKRKYTMSDLKIKERHNQITRKDVVKFLNILDPLKQECLYIIKLIKKTQS